MTDESVEAVRALRAEVAEERIILEDLGQRFTQPSMKEWVRRALLDLDDVEGVFLSRLDDSGRTARQDANLIRYAYMPLQVFAVPRRKQLQDIMAKYGPGVMLIGG